MLAIQIYVFFLRTIPCSWSFCLTKAAKLLALRVVCLFSFLTCLTIMKKALRIWLIVSDFMIYSFSHRFVKSLAKHIYLWKWCLHFHRRQIAYINRKLLKTSVKIYNLAAEFLGTMISKWLDWKTYSLVIKNLIDFASARIKKSNRATLVEYILLE